jgi:hypothetical protein
MIADVEQKTCHRARAKNAIPTRREQRQERISRSGLNGTMTRLAHARVIRTLTGESDVLYERRMPERGEPVADVLSRDLVSLLRERGYRARSDRGDEELRLNAELINFLIDTKQGFWSGSLEGIAVVKLQIVDTANGREVWSDVVRANHVKSGLQFTSEGDHQEVAERLYQELLTNIRAAVPDARSALRVSGAAAN